MSASRRAPSWINPLTIIATLGLLSLGLWLGVPPTLAVRGPLLLNYLPLYFALFAPYLAATLFIARSPISNLHSPFLILLFALLFRLPLLFHPPTLSDDVYRYIWDGRVLNNGINPYQYRVDSPELDFLTTPNRALVNNPSMASPYLPAAQLYFAVGYRLWPESPAVFQIGAALFDLATGLVLMRLLRQMGRPPGLAILYLWNPLVVVEFAHGAHVDALMVLLMIAALWADERRRLTDDDRLPSVVGGPFLLALATLVKPIPLVLLPILGPRWGWRGLSIFGLTIGLAFVPFAGAGLGLGDTSPGTGLFGALAIFMRYWNFNAGLFHWLSLALTGQSLEGALPADLPGVMQARMIIMGLMIGSLIWVGWRSWKTESAPRWWPVPIAIYLLLSPTVHPWYLAPLIALLPFAHPSLWVFIYWSAAAGLSYLTYLDPALHREVGWVRWWEYGPLYALLMAAYIHRRTRAL